jgi:RNA polymerase sigma factor (sigma-70 family)
MSRSVWNLLRSRLARAATDDPTSDAALLTRYLTARDETAFELLVWRHAALVLGVCRRILRDEHAAEDAFQATFIILARKAATIRRSDSLAGWLHRVARRVAVRAARTQRQPESLPDDLPAPTVEEPEFSTLDAAIDRLPARLRLPVVYCYLQEMTTEQAAGLLGIPRGTVLSRLATARKRLAERLTRQGVTPSATIVVPTVSVGLIATTLRAAVTFVAGDGAVTGSTLLATEVLRMTAWKKTAGLVAAVVLSAGLSTGIGMVASGQGKPGDAAAKPADPPKPATPPTDPEKDQAQKRDRLLRSVSDRLAEVSHRIEAHERHRQEAIIKRGSEVDVKSLLAALQRQDEAILNAEEHVALSDARVLSEQSDLAGVDAWKPSDRDLDTLITRRLQQSVEVAEASAKIDTHRKMAEKLKADSLDLKKAREEAEAAARLIADFRVKVRPEVEREWHDTMKKRATARVESEVANRASAIKQLQASR